MQACFAKRIMHSHFRPCHHHCWHRSEPEWPSLHQISLFCRSPVWRMCPSLSALTGREARVRNTLALYVSVPLLCTQRCGHQLTRQLTFILPGKPLAGCVLLFSCSDASPSPRGCKLRVLYTSIILEAVTGVCFTTVQYIRGHVPRSANSITHCTGGDRRRRHHHHHHHHHDRHRTRKIDLRSASQAGLVGC